MGVISVNLKYNQIIHDVHFGLLDCFIYTLLTFSFIFYLNVMFHMICKIRICFNWTIKKFYWLKSILSFHCVARCLCPSMYFSDPFGSPLCNNIHRSFILFGFLQSVTEVFTQIILAIERAEGNNPDQNKSCRLSWWRRAMAELSVYYAPKNLLSCILLLLWLYSNVVLFNVKKAQLRWTVAEFYLFYDVLMD